MVVYIFNFYVDYYPFLEKSNLHFLSIPLLTPVSSKRGRKHEITTPAFGRLVMTSTKGTVPMRNLGDCPQGLYEKRSQFF